MKIVIISRFLYPMVGARAFRTTELAKFFAANGHDVTVYTPKGSYDYNDFIKNTGVKVKKMSGMPCTSGYPEVQKITFLQRVLTKLFYRLIRYPEIELMFTTKQVLAHDNDADLLITIAVPFSIHWGAAWACKRAKSKGTSFPAKWISDCGDPFMGNGIIKPPFYFKYLEKFWGKQTDFITIPIEEGREAYYPEVQNKIRIIPQGFDFSSTKIIKQYVPNPIPTFAYAGMVYPGYRDPSQFLEYLCGLDADFRFVVYTDNTRLFTNHKNRLGEKLDIRNFVPRDELIYELSKVDFLINLLNDGKVQAPSKLIDYTLTQRPILDISSNFKESGNFKEFLNGNYNHAHEPIDLSVYDIHNVANAFLSL